jgi:hypothetical protein
LLTRGRLWCGPGVPDMPGVPADGDAVCAGLRAADEALRVLLADKDAVIAGLQVRNAELEARVARLELLVSRNSGNSSMPPSTDDLPGKKPPGKKPRSRPEPGVKRRPGKQPGAPGAHLA